MRLLPSLPLLTRDKADTLLLIAACLLVLLPHASHVDWWVNLGCALLLVWRSWLTLNGRRLPPAWILLPVSAAMMGGVYLTHHTFFGREAGVTMLVLLLTCKLLEMHAKRDLFVVIYLGFFLLLTSFFYQQSIGTAFITLLAVSLLLTAQLSFHYTGTIPSLLQRLKLGLTIVGLAIPLTIVAFFLFPRIQGPLWGLPGDAHAGRSGLSDSMTPGTISDLALSDDIAFRVKFTGAVPNKSLLYWRGIVLNYFDGKSWSRGRPAPFTGSTIASVSGPEIRQQIILEPNGQRWLFALDVPAAPPILENNAQSTLNLEMESRSAVPLFQRLRYAVRSYPQYRLRAEANAAELGDSLELPANYNPRTLTFAAELRQRYGDDRQLMSAVLQYFRHEPFSYTLEPPLLGINSVDDFLFSTRAGFCEHYASAFVTLMRAADIPARVVTGYQGGTLNVIDGFLEVRQSDAHAWAEIWLKGQGWIRVDPTAAVAPERIMQSLGNVLPQKGLGTLINLSKNSWLLSARMQWDAINNSWNQWVLNYNQTTQISLLRSLGFGNVDWAKIALIFFIAGSAILALIALPLTSNKKTISPLDRVYFSFCRKMAKHALPRAAHEGPIAYMQRLQAVLPPDQFTIAQKFLQLYAATRYGKTSIPDSSLIRRLKTLLSQCR